jgi:thioredoxin
MTFRRGGSGAGEAVGKMATVDVTDQTFQTEVIERSQREPVVVDFWADWCGPCKMLTPVLEQQTSEQGVTLAKIDVDANQRIAREYGISGIPAVKAFRNGQVVAEFVGAQPAARVKAFLDDLTGPSLADTIDDPEIAAALKAKDYERALQTLLARVETVKTPEERNAARELMVQIFQELGQEHPLASTYRKKLAAAIF